jgi:hypothetical protein
MAAVVPAAPTAAAAAAASKRTPSDFLKLVIGRSVIVKLNSGTTYHGTVSLSQGFV